MRRRTSFPYLITALLLTACASPYAAVRPPAPELTEALGLVNDARQAGATCGSTVYPPGGASLSWNRNLGKAAENHSEDMQAAGQLTHITPAGAIHYPPGTTFSQRAKQEGYQGSPVGENAAYGFSSATAVVGAWLASPGHCRNMMNPNADEIGIGRAGSYWTEVFGRSSP